VTFDVFREAWVVVRGDGEVYMAPAYANAFYAFPTKADAEACIRSLETKFPSGSAELSAERIGGAVAELNPDWNSRDERDYLTWPDGTPVDE